MLMELDTAGGFQLRKRALHVFAEAARVHAFRAVCNGDGDTEAKMAALGELMDTSQGSCRCAFWLRQSVMG